MNETAAKKDVQKLQRAVVDSLEDVKAQDLVVFDTEHISSLFERVIIASGTSNRQTKALATSVRDKVREAGFPKPRIEGEENGEWIIVDGGSVVVHIMQPAIRQYYHLEEIWGDKPVRLKKPAPPARNTAVSPTKAPTKAPTKSLNKTPAVSPTKAPAKAPGKAASKANTKAVGKKTAPGKKIAKP